MKNRFSKLVFISLCSTFLLAGCGDGGSGGVTSVPPVEYTASDIKYCTEAGETIIELATSKSSRTFYKAYDGFCAIALANIGNYSGPVLVGEDPVQVSFKQSGNKEITGAGGSVTVNGKEYYYSATKNLLGYNLDTSVKYPIYFSYKESLEEVAKNIISVATFQKVDESKKHLFSYELDAKGKYTISKGPYAEYQTELVIPAKYKDIDVTEIKESGFEGLNRLQKVSFENGSKIENINKYAFDKCTNLRYALIPYYVSKVGYGVFYNCPNVIILNEAEVITSAYNSDYANSTVKSQQSFWGYTGYYETEEFIFGVRANNELGVIKHIGNALEVQIPDAYKEKFVTRIEKYAFYKQNLVRSVRMPDHLSFIGESAFEECSTIEQFVLPSTTKTIEKYAFDKCTNLKYVFIPRNVEKVAYGVFFNCPNTLIINEAASKTAAYNSDYGNSDLMNKRSFWGYNTFYVSDSFVYGQNYIGELAVLKFIGKELNVVIPDAHQEKAITHIEKYAFYDQRLIKTVQMPSGLKTINESAFEDCQSLLNVVLPNTTTSIGKYAFDKCSAMKYVVIPASVTTCGYGAFYNCKNLNIFCGSASKPSGFNSEWKGSSVLHVYWDGQWGYNSEGVPVAL